MPPLPIACSISKRSPSRSPDFTASHHARITEVHKDSSSRAFRSERRVRRPSGILHTLLIRVVELIIHDGCGAVAGDRELGARRLGLVAPARRQLQLACE